MRLRLITKFNVGSVEKYPSRVFLSLLPSNDGFIGAIREYDPAHGNTRTDIRLLRFDSAGLIRSDRPVGQGEDPRLFLWRGEPHVLTWLETGRGDWHLFLLNIPTAQKVQLKIDPWMFHGKNWVPLPLGDRLLILRSLAPLVILEANPQTGLCHCIHGRPPTDTPIGQHRGGGAAHYKDGLITGFGHRTHNPEKHTVFHYAIDPSDWSIRTQDIEVIGVEGMGIIDPTSSFGDYVACCATPTFWWQWQPVLHGLFRVESD